MSGYHREIMAPTGDQDGSQGDASAVQRQRVLETEAREGFHTEGQGVGVIVVRRVGRLTPLRAEKDRIGAARPDGQALLLHELDTVLGHVLL